MKEWSITEVTAENEQLGAKSWHLESLLNQDVVVIEGHRCVCEKPEFANESLQHGLMLFHGLHWTTGSRILCVYSF